MDGKTNTDGIKAEESLENLPVEAKLTIIDSTLNLDNVPNGCLPPVRADNYYFVSYSHRDYKKVYRDIYNLQQRGISIWYDRGMSAGKNWKDIADEHICKYDCIGVILYISENSLMSQSIHEEIAYTKKCGKALLTVNLPVESDLTFEGKNIKGEILSAKSLLQALRQSGADISDEKFNSIGEYLGDEILYIPYDAGYDNKVEKIKGLKRPDIFKFKTIQDRNRAIVLAVNNIDVKKITRDDFICTDKEGKSYETGILSDCAFANCRRLQRVELPESLLIIGNYGFYGCTELKSVDLTSVGSIGEYAFSQCTGLEKVVLSDFITELKRSAFEGCTALKEIEFPTESVLGIKIEEKAFFGCKGLTNIIISESVEVICRYAFKYCTLLKSISIGENVHSIENDAFANCVSLQEVKLAEGIDKLNGGAFNYCPSLERIYLPATLHKLERPFTGCQSLTEIAVSPKNERLYSINGVLFDKKENALISYPCGKRQTSYEVPSGILEICGFAFAENKYLTEVAVPETVVKIASAVFLNCTALKVINYGGTRARWKMIKKQKEWANGANEIKIICTDGVIG